MVAAGYKWECDHFPNYLSLCHPTKEGAHSGWESKVAMLALCLWALSAVEGLG